MTWGVVTIGGIEFREETDAREDLDGGLRIFGQESTANRSRAHVDAAQDNIRGMRGLVVPVTFTDKSRLSGFYLIAGGGCDQHKWANGAVQTATWSLDLIRVGAAADVEIESRVPTVGRSDTLTGTQTPVFWHAPAGGTKDYYTGPTVPASTITRDSADGPVVVHLGIPVGRAPRWTVAADDYLNGSARLIFDGERRIGSITPPEFETWEMSNGLVRVQGAASGAVTVSAWDSGAWRSAKGYQFTATSALTTTPEVSILRNDPEECAIRLSYPTSAGRVTVDLSLRRGARFLTGTVKRHSAATLGVVRTAAEAATATTGGLRATSADADGNQFVMGSSRTATTATGTAAISVASVTSFDFFLGYEFGSSPQAGDAFADLLAQYLGSTGERVLFRTRGGRS